MSGWDVEPSSVSAVLASTQTNGDKILSAWNGSGIVLGIVGIADEIPAQAQSQLIQSALSGFFDSENGTMTSVVSRIQGVMNATVQVVNDVVAGDEDIAASVQVSMATACGSGDFSQFLEG